MPRLPRLHVPGGCYHVILRGNHREALFGSDHDRIVLNDIVAEVLDQQQARIHSFCWMTNHLPALIQIGSSPLGAVMQRIARRYSRYRHRQLHTTGHLFERRYRAWVVDMDAYFIALVRYIHLNPVKARMVKHVDDYRWSSHRAYQGEATIPWLTTDFGLSLLGPTVEVARRNYRKLISQEMYASEDRLLDDTHPDDARILGTDRFIASLPVATFKPRSTQSLSQLAQQICVKHSMSFELVCSASRQRSLTPIRVAIATQALDEHCNPARSGDAAQTRCCIVE